MILEVRTEFVALSCKPDGSNDYDVLASPQPAQNVEILELDRQRSLYECLVTSSIYRTRSYIQSPKLGFIYFLNSVVSTSLSYTDFDIYVM